MSIPEKSVLGLMDQTMNLRGLSISLVALNRGSRRFNLMARRGRVLKCIRQR